MNVSSSASSQPNPADVAISICNVSKMYPLYADPRDRLKQSLWYALPGFLRANHSPRFFKEFWALTDVSFEVKKGQAVGIIGRNGSGKSTLLQIIAGTLSPTQGQVTLHGRVAALLELGSGFNPDFTGKENVYLNGSILGFSQAEIDALYDDVLAFADIGQFIDQPVKLYSSGMVIRLAFAVQVMVPKDVLIVDEALAVGDEAFQRKCMRALEEFRNAGGSVLLVSHDSQVINRHCEEAVLLNEGKLLVKDKAKLVTDIYQRLLYSSAAQKQDLLTRLQQNNYSDAIGQLEPLPVDDDAVEELIQKSVPVVGQAGFDPALHHVIEKSYGNGKAEIVDACLLDEQGNRVNVVISGQRYAWRYRVIFKQDARFVHFGMMLRTVDGVVVYAASTMHDQKDIELVKRGAEAEVSFQLDLNIAPGTYYFNCGVSAIELDDFVFLHRRVDVMAIRVLPGDARNYEGIAFLNHQIQYHFGVPQGDF
ncbi:MAG: Vitamin B12 import ATP-binding protein BtuD [Anaerolineae bacterium]|nr:Vitamin B12 import ATP-binding protein BtuD [Anaerolineae bacterium]